MTETVILVCILIFALSLGSRGSAATPSPVFNPSPPESLDNLYDHYGNMFDIDPLLLKAISIIESGENPNAANPSDPSYGLMQLLCIPDDKGSCANRLNVVGWPPEDVERLFDPDYSLYIAAQILRWNLDQYGMPKGIAVYNAWKAHTDPQDGPFVNQGYVDKVLKQYERLGANTGGL